MKLQNNFNTANKVKSKTIYYRVFLYFAAFSVVILLTLWFLQIFFLQTFYQAMKLNELYDAANAIDESLETDSLTETTAMLAAQSDIYIQIERAGSSVPIYSTDSSFFSDRSMQFAQRYNTSVLKAKLNEETTPIVVKQITSPGNTETMIYASILGVEASTGQTLYCFIFSPLAPVRSTINILSKMLIIVTILSTFIGIIMSLVISRRLARPLNSISKSAAQLAEGHYDITFEGTGYAETEELAATLNYAAEELSKSDRLQKDLVANVSHDLKTPLTMVKSYAEMIRDISGDNPEKRNRHLQVIISEADRLNLLVNDLTSLSKMQAGVDSLNLTDVDLKSVASDVIESFSLHAEQDGFRFELDVQGNTTVPADEKKIYRVFSNLVGNAVRYSGDDRRITISIAEKQETVRCEVIDRGQGISEDDLTSIWDRYYQSSSNHSRTSKGSGLGLSIVKQIFILHRADYGVESVENEGSTFWFELPKRRPQASPRKLSKKEARQAASEAANAAAAAANSAVSAAKMNAERNTESAVKTIAFSSANSDRQIGASNLQTQGSEYRMSSSDSSAVSLKKSGAGIMASDDPTIKMSKSSENSENIPDKEV